MDSAVLAFVLSLRASALGLAQHRAQLLQALTLDGEVEGMGCSKAALVGELKALAEGLLDVVAGARLEQSSPREGQVG
jgi:hypothetical protein